MEDNKIYVKKAEDMGNSLKITLSIFDSTLPKFTTGSIIVPPVLDIETGSIIISETTEEIQIARPEIDKIITVPVNYPIEHIESLIKKERDFFNCSKEDIKEKISYFKDKIY